MTAEGFIIGLILLAASFLTTFYLKRSPDSEDQSEEIELTNKSAYTKVRKQNGQREVYDLSINQWLLWELVKSDCTSDEKIIIEIMFHMQDEFNSVEGININSITSDMSSNSSGISYSSNSSSNDTNSDGSD
ncbi:hypothetical protein [Parashewanella tropica]|uniref:hypothetical protein n=1 Tax=Parashewanella tropica TaxID=2547970 RepID=UPI001059266F|nr:hypothetical protein [Parashewanella tropica]